MGGVPAARSVVAGMTRLLDRLLRLASRVGLPGATDQDRAEYAAVRRQILAWVERPGVSVAALIRVHRQIRAAGALAGENLDS